MSSAAHIRRALGAAGGLADADIDVAETALLLAAVGRPRLALEPYRRHLGRLAGEVAAYAGEEGRRGVLARRAEALGQVIARRFGYGDEGDDADDADDANLTWIIDRRRGTSAGLGILYLHAARAAGWAIAGIDFPPRFLVRLESGVRRLILDPLGGGRVLAPADLRALLKASAGNQAELRPSHYRVLGNRGVLLRLQNDAKTRLLCSERLEDALQGVEVMLLFAPDAVWLWRESGLLAAKLERVEAAVAALEEYVRRTPADAARYRTSILLQELRGRLS